MAPKNCLECKHSNNCLSYYGSTKCKHNEEINKNAVKMLFTKNVNV